MTWRGKGQQNILHPASIPAYPVRSHGGQEPIQQALKERKGTSWINC